MTTHIDLPALKSILIDLYQLTKHQCAFIDTEFNAVIRYPKTDNAFCEYIQSTPEGCAKCAACDREAFKSVSKNPKIYIYRCHAGLIEVCAPIYSEVDSKNLLGYLMIGHLLDDNLSRTTQWNDIYKSCSEYISDMPKLNTYFSQLLPISKDTIISICNVMQIYAEHILMKKIIQHNQNSTWLNILNFVEEHYTEQLPISNIADALSISLTTLNRYAKQHTGRSINDYILHKRLSLACSLLQQTTKSITAIATEVGIADYNYFSRIFKKKMGITPRAYRQTTAKNLHPSKKAI